MSLHLSDAQVERECRDLAANPPRYSWERDCYHGRFTWAEWHKAAVTALDCGDFSEYRWMCEQNDEDDDGEVFEN